LTPLGWGRANQHASGQGNKGQEKRGGPAVPTDPLQRCCGVGRKKKEEKKKNDFRGERGSRPAEKGRVVQSSVLRAISS